MLAECVVKATFISCAILIEPRTLRKIRKENFKNCEKNIEKKIFASNETFWMNIRALKSFRPADKHEKLNSESIKLWKISAILQD